MKDTKPRGPTFRPQFSAGATARMADVATQRGGARPGAGRKAVDGATGVVQICITVRPGQRPKLAKLGGSAWVRGAIDAAVIAKPHSANAE